MADGLELPVGEYKIMATEEPRKYVMAVKLSTRVINHLQKGLHRTASICFGKENKFIVDNEQYTFTVQQENNEQDCYIQSSDMLAEIGGVKKKLLFTQELTGEDRARIKELSQQAEMKSHNRKSIVLPPDGKAKKGNKPSSRVVRRIVSVPPSSRLVVPTPQVRTPPQPSTPPLRQPRPSTPPPPSSAAVPSPQTQTPPAASLSPPQSTPPQPLLSPPQPPQQKVLSPPTSTPTPPLPYKSKSAARSRAAPTPTQPTPPAPKEIPSAPPTKFPLRTHLIHELALRPMTIARLIEMHNVPKPELTKMLFGLAQYNPSPGLWFPKDEMFQEVDPEWYEYSPEDREAVREKKKEALAKLAAAPPAPVEDKTLAAATKNLKDIIPVDPSEKRKKPRIDRPPPATSSSAPSSTPSLPPSSTPPPASSSVPPLPSTPPLASASTPPLSNELSPPTQENLSPIAESLSAKKRTRDPAASLPNSKIAKPNPSTPETSSPSLTPTPSVPAATSSAPLLPTPSTAPSAPSSAPPSATTPKPRKPPHSSLKPPASHASPIPTPTSSPFVTPNAKKAPKTAPSPIPTPTKSTPSPATKPTQPSKPPSASKPASTPSSTPPATPTPPKPTKSTSKSNPAPTKTPSSSTSARPPPSKSAPKSSSKPPSRPPSKTDADAEPALKPIPPPPKFNIFISNNQENEKYRKAYGEKYAIYRELHRKLTENRDVFVQFDKDWKTLDPEGRRALSLKIESTYLERRADVERTQAEHSALHAELIAIKEAMKKYVDSARSNAGNNAKEHPRPNQANPQQKQPPTQKLPQKKASPPSQGLQSPPLKTPSEQKQKVTPPKPSSATITQSSQGVQSPQKPKAQPRRQTPPPPTQKQKPVATK